MFVCRDAKARLAYASCLHPPRLHARSCALVHSTCCRQQTQQCSKRLRAPAHVTCRTGRAWNSTQSSSAQRTGQHEQRQQHVGRLQPCTLSKHTPCCLSTANTAPKERVLYTNAVCRQRQHHSYSLVGNTSRLAHPLVCMACSGAVQSCHVC